jgi:hypothetical protein
MGNNTNNKQRTTTFHATYFTNLTTRYEEKLIIHTKKRNTKYEPHSHTIVPK